MTSLFDNVTSPIAWVPGYGEMIVILLVLLLLFGGKKLPELARGMARSIKGFKSELREVKDAVTSEPEEETPVAKSDDEDSRQDVQ